MDTIKTSPLARVTALIGLLILIPLLLGSHVDISGGGSATGGGWIDNGTTIELITPTDDVGIGTTAVAGSKVTLPQVNDAVTPTLSFGDGDTGLYEASDDSLGWAIAGSRRFQLFQNTFQGDASTAAVVLNENASATNPVFAIKGDTNTGVGAAGLDQLSLIAGAVEMARLTEDATTGNVFDVQASLAQTSGTIAADDVTPDVSDANIFVTSANTGATAITDLDNPAVDAVITICGGSNTNSSTIADSGNFNIQGAMTLSLDDCISLWVQADNDYVEIYARTDN